MSHADGDYDVQKSKGRLSTLMAEGDWLYHKGEYKKAIDSFTAALAVKPDDRNCLVGRSKCYLKVGESDKALKDAEASLREDKSFYEGLYQKAEALYYMGEFEFALVFYHRGQKLRPQMQEFRLGIQKAQEAIENAVGCPTKVKLEIKGDLSFLQNHEEGAQPISAIQHLTEERKQPLSMTPKREKTTKQLLGEFYSDKKYLENLLKDEDLVKGKSGKKLKDVVQNSLTYLDTCTEFWTQEKTICSQDHKLMQQRCSKSRHDSSSEHAQFLLRSLQDIDAELMSGNAKGSLKKAEEAMKTVQGWPNKEISKKKEALGSLHSCIGNALIDLGNMDKALEHHQKDLELAEQCKLPEATSRALENIGRVYAQMGKFVQAIEFWERKTPLLSGGVEKTWLFHELGWCHLKLNRLKESRDYGLRSIAAAEEIADEEWLLNANVLVAQSEIKLGNTDSSVTHFETALTYARLKENNCAVNGILKALDEAKQQLDKDKGE